MRTAVAVSYVSSTYNVFIDFGTADRGSLLLSNRASKVDGYILYLLQKFQQVTDIFHVCLIDLNSALIFS